MVKVYIDILMDDFSNSGTLAFLDGTKIHTYTNTDSAILTLNNRSGHR